MIMKRFIAFAAVVVLSVFLSGCMKNDDTTVNINDKKNYACANMEKIVIDYFAADIDISVSSRSDIAVEISGKTSSNLKYTQSEERGTIYLCQSICNKNTAVRNNHAKLKIEIPENLALDYSVKLSAGDFTAESCNIDSINVKQTVGDVTLDKCSINEKSSISVDIGDVAVSGCDKASVDNLDITVKTGDKKIDSVI